MTQFLVLARQRLDPPSATAALQFRQTADPFFLRAAESAFGLTGGSIFVPESLVGEPFESLDERLNSPERDAAWLDTLVDDCAARFRALAFFYGDAENLPQAKSADQLRNILREQCDAGSWELYASWIEQ
jgi:hypothetical protein